MLIPMQHVKIKTTAEMLKEFKPGSSSNHSYTQNSFQIEATFRYIMRTQSAQPPTLSQKNLCRDSLKNRYLERYVQDTVSTNAEQNLTCSGSMYTYTTLLNPPAVPETTDKLTCTGAGEALIGTDECGKSVNSNTHNKEDLFSLQQITLIK